MVMESLGPTSAGPKTLRRGLQILDTLREAGPDGLRIPDIAARTGIHRPTVYRFLEVLIDMGYVKEGPEARSFTVGSIALNTESSHTSRLAKLKLILRKISDECGDSSFLVTQSDNDSLCIHREVGDYPVQVLAVSVGHRQPLGVGAAGLALLASMPQDQVQEIVAANAERLRQFGGMTATRLLCLVKATRERGWAVVGNAAVPGVLGVGVAVSQPKGRPTMALSVSGLTERMSIARQRMIVEVIHRNLASLR